MGGAADRETRKADLENLRRAAHGLHVWQDVKMFTVRQPPSQTLRGVKEELERRRSLQAKHFLWTQDTLRQSGQGETQRRHYGGDADRNEEEARLWWCTEETITGVAWLHMEIHAHWDERTIDLRRDRRSWSAEGFPRGAQKKGRERELKHILYLMQFRTLSWTMKRRHWTLIWVEERARRRGEIAACFENLRLRIVSTYLHRPRFFSESRCCDSVGLRKM